ncbi:PREDICTED: 5'-3' exoribonuclease 1 [Ceratosolen solmsi marchali]|uniref:5'-3' exoribonuclease 1 n=1 Tax=Ceratosolen solmsi marchali TaxID=326594 RepID=A0AAJ7DZ68_9HYME|nr:PREDICTED: 5'-3' exoribonuclease 1 [Ceratosolen solmsi marchali]
MGIPKFFRFTSERYPCIVKKLNNEHQIPTFDNLYLDMNGIIHVCSHPNDNDVTYRISEEEIFKNIFHYIEILFRLVKPEKLFFLALDGVAPRAKVNQQRSRRFKSIKNMELIEAKARERGEKIPEEKRFDSNCITPGTVFMAKLNEQLKYFVTYKISTDKLWRRCEVILSGSDVPGEGEHKIMDYLRYIKAKPTYDGKTRHCLYGLDADLIILGLSTHQPYFSILREEVKFNKSAMRSTNIDELQFCLLHLSLLRDYIEHEFSSVKDKLRFKFDIESIIDDWILMSFLVGNDFIPSLPYFYIGNNAFIFMYQVYINTLPTLDGYINEGGILNLKRFKKFLQKLGQFDIDYFIQSSSDTKDLDLKSDKIPCTMLKNDNHSPKLLATKSEDSHGHNEDNENDNANIEDNDNSNKSDKFGNNHFSLHEFEMYKHDYYMDKMHIENEDIDEKFFQDHSEMYIKTLQWNLHYYYNGCCSWSWYFPNHYTLFISDIKDFENFKIEFDMAKPFLPFEQLLATFPAASHSLLPAAYHKLIIDKDSPLHEFYPEDFEVDLNGKKHEWEAIVLIPLIDEKRLLEAMEPCNKNLTAEEKRRNRHKQMSVYTYTEISQGFHMAPEYFPSIESYAQIELVDRETIIVPQDKLIKGIHKGFDRDVLLPGFPMLQHIPHTCLVSKAKLKIFELPSRNENMILTLIPKKAPPIKDLAKKWIGKTVFVSWPFLSEALVVEVSNSKLKMLTNQTGKSADESNLITKYLSEKDITRWFSSHKFINETYKMQMGIEIGDIEIIVWALPILGKRYVYDGKGEMILEKQWSDKPLAFAYQLTLFDLKVHEQYENPVKPITDIFTPKSVCFMLGHPHYGSMGEVTDAEVDLKSNRIKVAMKVVPEPNLNEIQKLYLNSKNNYMTVSVAAQRLNISCFLFTKITGTVFAIHNDEENPKWHHIGLNLKFTKMNEKVMGYTQKINDLWFYSDKTVKLVDEYMRKFPKLFLKFEKHISSPYLLTELLFSENCLESLQEVLTWLKEQQKKLNLTLCPCDVEFLEEDAVQALEKVLDESIETQRKATKTVLMQVKPHLLYRPCITIGAVCPDPNAQHRILDRIICTRENFPVPLGYKGTIISLHLESDNPTCQVIFDKEFVEGLSILGSSPNRCYKMAITDFINISFGINIENKNVSKTNIVPFSWRQRSQQSDDQHQQQQQQQQQQQKQSRQQSHRHSYQQQHKQFNDSADSSRTPEHLRKSQATSLKSNNQSPNQSHFYSMFAKDGQQNNKCNDKSQSPAKSYSRHDLFTQPDTLIKPSDNNYKCNITPMTTSMVEMAMSPNELLMYYNSRKKTVVLQKQLNRCTRTSLPSTQNVKSIDTQPTKTPQELWKELNDMQKPVEPAKKQIESTAKDETNPISANPDTSPQDPSAFLKAILKISDEKTQSNKASSSTPAPLTNKPLQFTQTPKATDTPPLVQQLFDHHSRQTEMKGDNNSFYRLQVSSHFQMLGSEPPRYVYSDSQENTVRVQVLLPDLGLFFGDYCHSYNEAVESAAKKVYEELKLDKRVMTLHPPPRQWFNNTINNIRHPGAQPVNVNPVLPSAFPQVQQVPQIPPIPPIPPIPQIPQIPQIPPIPQIPQIPQLSHVRAMQFPMPKWNPTIPQNPLANFTHHVPQQMNHQLHQPKQQARFPPQSPRSNFETKPIKHEPTIINSTPFVPLQAQKKTRKINKQLNSDEQHKEPQQQQQQQQQQHKPQEKKFQQQQQQKQQEKRPQQQHKQQEKKSQQQEKKSQQQQQEKKSQQQQHKQQEKKSQQQQNKQQDKKVQNKQQQQQPQQQQQQQQQQQKQQPQQKRDSVDNKMDQKFNDVDAKQINQETRINNKFNESDMERSPAQYVQNAQKGQKFVKQRRSRVAAKFQSDPITNGGEEQ